jgi:2-iminobutanoate/2-iminopropanoate deaminase
LFSLPLIPLVLCLVSTEVIAADTSAVFHTRPGSTAPYSPAVRAGDFIFASGQIGVEVDGSVPANFERQAKLAIENTRDALVLAGAGLGDVVKCTVMLRDMTQWPVFNRVYAGYFAPGRLPARSAFGTQALAMGAGVELECMAYKPEAGK